jgi:hypothetical protein
MGVLIPILVLGHGFEELLHRGRPQRSGQGDGKLAAIRCYSVFLAFPKSPTTAGETGDSRR